MSFERERFFKRSRERDVVQYVFQYMCFDKCIEREMSFERERCLSREVEREMSFNP